CENSDVQLACRTSISISSIWESIVLPTSSGRRQLRKQFCASFAQARFHTAWTQLGHRAEGRAHRAGLMLQRATADRPAEKIVAARHRDGTKGGRTGRLNSSDIHGCRQNLVIFGLWIVQEDRRIVSDP